MMSTSARLTSRIASAVAPPQSGAECMRLHGPPASLALCQMEWVQVELQAVSGALLCARTMAVTCRMRGQGGRADKGARAPARAAGGRPATRRWAGRRAAVVFSPVPGTAFGSYPDLEDCLPHGHTRLRSGKGRRRGFVEAAPYVLHHLSAAWGSYAASCVTQPAGDLVASMLLELAACLTCHVPLFQHRTHHAPLALQHRMAEAKHTHMDSPATPKGAAACTRQECTPPPRPFARRGYRRQSRGRSTKPATWEIHSWQMP